MFPESHEHILVIKLGALGDFVQALGPMAAIRRFHPQSQTRITLLTTAPFVEFARRSGYFDEILTDRRPKWFQTGGWIKLARQLRAGRFSRVYDLQNNDRTAFYLRLFSKVGRPEWVGAAPGASHRNTSPQRTAGKAFDGHVQTLALAGIREIGIDPMDWIADETARFDLPERFALLVSGCAPSHPEKRWPAASFATLAAHLAGQDITPVLIGTEADRNATSEIAAACPQARDLTGRTTLYDLPPLARKAAIAVGNDTGPMHLIGPAGCPSLVLFSGNSKPHRHAPLGAAVHTLQVPDLKNLTCEDVLTRLASVNFIERV